VIPARASSANASTYEIDGLAPSMIRILDSSIDQSLLASFVLGIGVQDLWQNHELFWEQYFPNYEYAWTDSLANPYGLVLDDLRWAMLILAHFSHPVLYMEAKTILRRFARLGPILRAWNELTVIACRHCP
jgi:hypothetical protein